MKKVDSRRNALMSLRAVLAPRGNPQAQKKWILALKLWIATRINPLAMTEKQATQQIQATTQAARLKTSKATILNTHKGGRILRLES